MFTLSAAGGWFDCDYYQKYYEAKKNGFSAMEELGWVNYDLDRARAAIDESGVALTCINVQTRNKEYAELHNFRRGIVCEKTHTVFLKSLEETLAAALMLNCKRIVVTTGNESDDVSRYVQHTNVVTALRKAAEIVGGSGVKIVLEPLNILVDHKGYYMPSTAEAVEIIDEVGSPDVMVLYDIYHQQITEGNIISTIRANISKIGHFHIGDVPGRREPGTGELNYRNIFKAIAETGYSDYAAFECGRSTDTVTVCKNMLDLIRW